MKSFSQISNELRESKHSLPVGFHTLKRNQVRFCGESVDVVFAVKDKSTHIILNGRRLDESFGSLKQAEEEFKLIRSMMEEMVSANIPFGEIVDEINIRV